LELGVEDDRLELLALDEDDGAVLVDVVVLGQLRRGEPVVRLATGFSAASVKLKPSIAVGRNEARATLVPTASMTQRKRLKTLFFQQPFAMRRFLDSLNPKHYGPRGFLGRQELPGLLATPVSN